MTYKIERPNSKEAKNWIAYWGSNLLNYQIQEKILDKLFKQYSSNTNELEIKVKVNTLNLYYSTHVQATDQMVKHICKIKELDKRLKCGDLSVIQDIANLKLKKGRKKCFYSFATKYASFHNHSAYPIYDAMVRELLYRFNKKYKFYENGKYTLQNLTDCNNYQNYKDLIDAFKKRFQLENFNYKEIDCYLWTLGKDITANKKNKKKQKISSCIFS